MLSSGQCSFTLLTAHKGVDLHAATALQVMRERLDGGSYLVGLFRCRWHTFADPGVTGGVAALLATGRYYNPNKHHYGVFARERTEDAWFLGTDHVLPGSWPGRVQDSDLETDGGLFDRLLGGPAGDGQVAVDVATLVRGQDSPVTSGVLWRLVLTAAAEEAVAVATRLAVARRRKEGLLLNPHLEDWLTGPVRPGPERELS